MAKHTRIVAIIWAVAYFTFITPALSQEVQRNPLQQSDLVTEGETEVVMAELVLMPGASIPRHFHPGDEYVYIIDGGSAKTLDGKEIEFVSGQSIMYPRGQVHGGFTVTGSETVKVITVHIVDKDVPILVPVTE